MIACGVALFGERQWRMARSFCFVSNDVDRMVMPRLLLIRMRREQWFPPRRQPEPRWRLLALGPISGASASVRVRILVALGLAAGGIRGQQEAGDEAEGDEARGHPCHPFRRVHESG